MTRPPTVVTGFEVEPRPEAALILVTGQQGTGKSTIADRLGDALAAPVFAWDWLMGALTPFGSVQDTFRSLDAPTYRAVGWSLMLQAARAQLRRGFTVILDGMARDDNIASARALGRETDLRSLVVLMTCADEEVVRARIEGRTRGIPGWHELTWSDVKRSRPGWVPPVDVDLVLDSTLAVDVLVTQVLQALEQVRSLGPER